MTFTVKLEHADGTPAEPPTMGASSRTGASARRSRSGPDRSLRVVGIVVSNDDEPSVLIVEDGIETLSPQE
jgi:hypothetical protein